MTYELYIGDYAYSSWSLRGWLLFHRFDIPVTTRLVDFNAGSVAEQLGHLAPARTVPALRLPEGAVIADSLAIAEELATRHPGAGFWPADPSSRATARALAAEMHSGFGALREHCPMNLRTAYSDFPAPPEVLDDLARLEEIWSLARAGAGGEGPWLCGPYSVADVFFAPVAARIAGYGLPVSRHARDYVAAHLADPAFRRWRAMGLVRGDTLPWYARDCPQVPWPGPAPIPASAVGTGPSENATCPYSGKPVSHFLEVQGRVFGFCNAFCRDKTAADPAAWPAFMEIYDS
ncbi:MAG: glutathione S-transferase [Rhodobacter sp.]|nr:glutathione S-transferase [Rhodobacter sp.]